MSDLINRQAAIDALARTAREKFNLSDEYSHYLAGLMDGELAIKNLPSAEPKTGKWIPVRSYEAFGGDEMMWAVRGNPIALYYCSNCRNDAYAGEDGESLLTKYCPECGAKMEVDHE